MFVRIPSLLDILHCYFLHGAPWHDVLFSTSPLKRNQSPLLGFYERSNPVEKVYTTTLLCHPRRSVPWPLNATNAIFSVNQSNFLTNIQPLWSQKLLVGRFFVSPPSCPVPLTAPTKLPAYPSSPTPIWATGTLHYAPWTNPPASEQAAQAAQGHCWPLCTLCDDIIYLNVCILSFCLLKYNI